MVHKRKKRKKKKQVKKKLPKFTSKSGFTSNGKPSGLKHDRKIDASKRYRNG